jgi:flagellar biosynthesis protein
MSAAEPQPALGAVALRYAPGETAAPRVVAKARGEGAERILALAREHGVPVREDRDLLELLALCELGEEIPEELYQVVAELVHCLWRLNEDLALRAPARPSSARAG